MKTDQARYVQRGKLFSLLMILLRAVIVVVVAYQERLGIQSELLS
ncbi:MAG: hypothetical protein H6Q62_543, partial [Firmicutes bacterium]|nr:hypothetical protein [Bacillota bacterium]